MSAIPDALSVPAARELVGQTHLLDHDEAARLKDCRGGPVHVIACQKGVTQAQAARMLGFPDATIVMAPFGVYVGDLVQSAQLILLSQCRDETSTRHAVQRFLEWLDESEQATALVAMAARRKALVKAMGGSTDGRKS